MKVAFLFSGQGAQYSGMMADIAISINESKNVFEIADNSLGRSISDLCFNGAQEELNLTHNTQPCVLAADLAAYAAISSYGIKPDVVAGFSLGEYAALVASGVLDCQTVFPLVQKRADYMQEAVPVGYGAMAAVMRLTESEVDSLCKEVDGYVVPANFNCPGQIVVSGTNEAIENLMSLAKERKIRAMKLPVSAPFHCELMGPAVEKLSSVLSEITFCSPTNPIYMNVDAKPEMRKEEIRRKLLLQAKSPVRWEDIINGMYADGVDTFIELGPGKTLSGFVKKTLAGDYSVFNVENIDTLRKTLEEIG